ncbi:arsenate reductase (glutaredoxin) [Pseudoduganella ginsengisoli]|uniref:Arsenate reductase n=1 Tax=Pseudoduganella ginsengisoli TaxID=1462440 RepID=A0A6L6PXU6_9BURK|nr:arsenate reductase (glutaredoxin) [Pseudoduganella ginsengisoli]MTW01758.1 arsenate reductase (glutaredoxin) [Pseudoduganella ginsengisoli]
MAITIYHNNACSNSRGALALIREAGIEPEIIEYLTNPPTREQLVALIKAAGLTARGAMRDKGELYEQLNLADPSLSDDALIDAMMAHPALINRPFVVTEKGVRLCRPPETVKEIL